MPNLNLQPPESEQSRSRSRPRARTEANEHRSMWDRLSFQTSKIGSWLRREEEEPPPGKQGSQTDEEDKENGRPHSSHEHGRHHAGFLHRRNSRKVVPGLPRPLTFKRMNSEKRDRLLPVPVDTQERRAASADRRGSSIGAKRALSPPPVSVPSLSAPDVLSPNGSNTHAHAHHKFPTIGGAPDSNIPAGARQVDYSMEDEKFEDIPPSPFSEARNSFSERESQRSSSENIDEALLQEELDAKWILNLSMHFRDNSDREKFFITYAEEPNKWRRVTVSCDYRQLQPDSLEADLKSLHYQRDKSARIYEAIRDSLPDIQFYDTVTNLKLQTADGRLHVHVTEDVNEIIPYPPVAAVAHLDCRHYRESDITFDSHISGFVYKIKTGRGQIQDSSKPKFFIKKEIPGPEQVEEFLYEVNALHSLENSRSVIKFEGIIVDDKSELIKGLLITYAERGALVDLIYDAREEEMPWSRRERWAKQIVEGLSEIHEAGFVQGDFTLSNIVVDGNDDAKVIDINRRGCPMGWEPPELAKLIESGQKVSIYIGVKSDLFQLGMVLWAIAELHDEPERQERPLLLSRYSEAPDYYREVVDSCLSNSPTGRLSAKAILARFPAITRDDFHDDLQSLVSQHLRSERSAKSMSPPPGPRSVMSLDDSELEPDPASYPASRETRWEQIYVDGDAKLVTRGPSQGLDEDMIASLQIEGYEKDMDVCITTPPSGEVDSMTASKISDGTTTEVQIPRSDASVVSALSATSSTDVGMVASLTFAHRVHDAERSNNTRGELLPPDYRTPARSTPSNEDYSHSPTSNLSPETQSEKEVTHMASFAERIHDGEGPKVLANLEQEVDMETSFPAPVHQGTGFSLKFGSPVHQDSGFAEGVVGPDGGLIRAPSLKIPEFAHKGVEERAEEE